MANVKTITGIDITAGRVSLAQLVGGEGEPKCLCVLSAEIPAGSESRARRASAALKALLRDNNIHVSKLAAVMPDQDAMFRVAMLPAASDAELEGMARLEMEYVSMLPPGQLNTGHYVLGSKAPGGFRTGIAAASKTAVSSLIEILRGAGLSPNVITTGGIAAARYFSPQIKEGEAALAIHGGAEGVSIYIITAAGLEMSHYAAADSYGGAMDGIIAGARLCAEQAGVERPASVLLFGDTSALPSPGAIEKALGIPASVSEGAEYVTDGSLNGAQRAAGAALELVAGQSTGANLLHAGADSSARRALNSAVARAGAAVASIIAVAAIAVSASAFQSQNRALEDADKRIAALKPRVEMIEKKQSTLRALNMSGEKQKSCLDVMLELSRYLPKDVFVTSLVFDKGNSVSVAGEAASQFRVASTIESLESSKTFKDIQLAYSRQTDIPGGVIVAFEIKASLSEAAAQ